MPNFPKYTLSIETATQKGSISLLKGKEEIGFWIGDSYQTLSASLLPQISSLLSAHDLTTKDLELIAVSAGPGSFTGARVGLSIAKALKTALNVPAIAVSLPEALALSAGLTEGNIVAIIPAGRTEAYWQEFSVKTGSLTPVSPILNIKVETPPSLNGNSATFITTSDLKSADKEIIENRVGNPVTIAGDGLARYIGEAAISRYMSETAGTPDLLQAIYIKELRS
ncbi:MAG TPA: tRNA (adenosine(37)-N6)-threonylcarbamoyltransferase complex dimerization subunit type 1 TsaB [Pyrinomonadaceae bacterium]|jgi:tRNA threonylcarbamoyl adenosine modification protein YeaZ|nr:tRNA (adenosine(37)-N6)-threonylcarbamoyltransferase complex dimerization subunit type 1 TsaB [Pyrinomonadaceae bacterium]